MKNKNISPWAWIPTLYFAQGLPYVAVMTISVIMYKNLGISNTDIALYTSWLYLPWVIKPFWSPFVDIIQNQTLVDSQHAAIGRCRTGRNRFHHTDVKLLPNDPCHFLASGIQLGYT